MYCALWFSPLSYLAPPWMENDEYNILYTVTFLDSINSESECFINLSHFSAAVLIGVSYFAVERCQNIKPTMQNWMQEEIRAGSTERLLGINSVSYHWRQPKQEREKIQLQVLPSYIFIWISLTLWRQAREWIPLRDSQKNSKELRNVPK